MKSINNLNTLNALINDELMAHQEYRSLAMDKNIPTSMRGILMSMSNDELMHAKNLKKYKEYLKKSK